MSRGGWKDGGLLGWVSEDGAAGGASASTKRGGGEAEGAEGVNPCGGNAEGNERAGCETCGAGRAAGIRSL